MKNIENAAAGVGIVQYPLSCPYCDAMFPGSAVEAYSEHLEYHETRVKQSGDALADSVASMEAYQEVSLSRTCTGCLNGYHAEVSHVALEAIGQSCDCDCHGTNDKAVLEAVERSGPMIGEAAEFNQLAEVACIVGIFGIIALWLFA